MVPTITADRRESTVAREARALRRQAAVLRLVGLLAMAAGPASAQPVSTAIPAAAASTPPARPVQLAVHYRGRVDAAQGTAAVRSADDTYYLNRIRLDATFTVRPWLRAFTQAQDAELIGFNGPPTAVPPTQVNRLDIRQAYVEFGPGGNRGVTTRLGRQELVFGEQRLIGNGDWNNTARSFDAARITLVRPGVKADVFAGRVVVPRPFDVDRRRTDEAIYGGYVSLDRTVPSGTIEPFVFVKRLDVVTGETGAIGRGHVSTGGVRATGKLPGHLDYSLEGAWQWGRLADDAVRASAGHYQLGWSRTAWLLTPRFVAEFNHASGDRQNGDGRRQTFDQLYATNHAKYGIADVIGWRNMRDAMVGVELWPTRRAKLAVDLHRLALATVQDGLYLDSGVRRLLNPAAGSTDVGTEVDLQATFNLSPRVSFNAGFGYLAAGEYLRRTTGGGNVWLPYAMWNVRF